MTRYQQAAFWDSSALVPLCVRQSTTAQLESLAGEFSPVVWWGTVVEMHSAVSRLHRSGEIDDSGRRSAIGFIEALRFQWREIAPSDQVRKLAESALVDHPLRAADSLQLAAALIWCEETPAGRYFVASDRRLCDAAAMAGFSIVQPGAAAIS